MRFTKTRILYTKTTKNVLLSKLEEGGTRLLMSNGEEEPSERAKFYGGSGEPSRREVEASESKLVPEFAEDYYNAAFYAWIHSVFPLLMNAVDETEVLLMGTLEVLEKVLQRPHNEKVRKEANDFLRKVLEHGLVEEPSVANSEGE